MHTTKLLKWMKRWELSEQIVNVPEELSMNYFGLVAERLFTEDDFTTNEKGDLVLKEGIPAQTFSAIRPGDIKYMDIDGDGVITNKDEKAMGGTVNPEIVYGFGATARYKKI